ncbi:MAG TPA: hypothetical protein VKP66_14255, partial [Steroidobacteraceae bacterium]|nr:hypothetical protein [Steroidobacteraceae bacterium]
MLFHSIHLLAAEKPPRTIVHAARRDHRDETSGQSAKYHESQKASKVSPKATYRFWPARLTL